MVLSEYGMLAAAGRDYRRLCRLFQAIGAGPGAPRPQRFSSRFACGALQVDTLAGFPGQKAKDTDADLVWVCTPWGLPDTCRPG